VSSASDILDELSTLFPERRMPQRTHEEDAEPSQLPPGITEAEAAIMATLDGEMTPELVAEKSGLPLPSVSASLLTLEIKRLVRQMPGRLFVKLAKIDAPASA
jgi:DNA processing protein